MPKSTLEKKPLIWILQGAHLGDNLQSKALADALGWSQKSISLEFNGTYRLPNFLLGGTLKTLQPSSKSQIRGPWPDLVIGAGRRSVPVARWIKARAGGACKIVQIGRPRAALNVFDLVVSTPQYDLPDAANIVQNLMPLSAPPMRMGAGERQEWLDFFSHLPRPWTGVFVGGSTWPFVLDSKAAADLGRKASSLAAHEKGSLLLSSGPRTSPEVAAVLTEEISAPVHIHKFGSRSKNPYQAMLALCDSFIVTGDSVSMISEACKTGKPVFIYDVPRRKGGLSGIARAMDKARQGAGPVGWMLERLAATGMFSPPRNVARFHGRIIQAGHVARLGSPDKGTGKALEDELAATARRVELLFGPNL